LGDDILTGRAGADAFVFQTSITRNGFSNVDTIIDFNVADDIIWLENAIFTKLATAGVLNAAFFHVGAVAADPNDYITYHKTTGDIFYDADGSGAGRETRIAHVTPNLALTAADFFVI
jgi:serralysin